MKKNIFIQKINNNLKEIITYYSKVKKINLFNISYSIIVNNISYYEDKLDDLENSLKILNKPIIKNFLKTLENYKYIISNYKNAKIMIKNLYRYYLTSLRLLEIKKIVNFVNTDLKFMEKNDRKIAKAYLRYLRENEWFVINKLYNVSSIIIFWNKEQCIDYFKNIEKYLDIIEIYLDKILRIKINYSKYSQNNDYKNSCI